MEDAGIRDIRSRVQLSVRLYGIAFPSTRQRREALPLMASFREELAADHAETCHANAAL